MSWKVRKLSNPVWHVFTLREILQAIEDNGLPQAMGAFWKNNTSSYDWETEEEFEVYAACAIGQGALNLGVDYNDLSIKLGSFQRVKRGSLLNKSIMTRNDGSKWSVPRIGRHFKKIFEAFLDNTVELQVKYEVRKG